MATSDDRGRRAESPRGISWRGWRDVGWRVKSESSDDNVSLVAAGVAFYALLALVPALGAIVLLYGLFADPASIAGQVQQLDMLPAQARDLVGQQLQRVTSTSSTALGIGLVFSLLLSLWSASKGVKAVVAAMNIAYDEEEERGFLRLNGLALAFTLGAIVAVILGLAVIGGVPAVMQQLALPTAVGALVAIGCWAVLLAGLVALLGLLYRFGPSRRHPRWRWVSPGSVLAAVLWAVASIGFSVYASQFGSYNKTYGTMAGVVLLLMWFWISALVVLLGAEVNAEVERQVERDTTAGRERPRGRRGAHVADTVGQPT